MELQPASGRRRLRRTPAATAAALSWLVGVGAVEPAQLEGFLVQLHREQDASQELEGVVSDLRERLAAAEGVFAAAAGSAAAAQPGLANQSETIFSNERIVTNLTEGIANLTGELHMLRTASDLVVEQASDAANATNSVLLAAKELSSLGSVKSRVVGGGCLDAPAAGAQGSRVQIWNCLKTQESQQWVLDPESGSFQQVHGICLAAPEPGTVGSSLMMWTCDRSLVSQRWSYEREAGLLKSSGGLCLEAADPPTRGSALVLASCELATPGQHWDMVVGHTVGLRQRMDNLYRTLWDLQDPAKSESLQMQEAQLHVLEHNADEFEVALAGEARAALVKRLRHGANRLRRALGRLGLVGSAWHCY